MKPYGIKRKDANCCPGHSKFPIYDSYRNRKSKKARARDKQLAHSIARAKSKQEIINDKKSI